MTRKEGVRIDVERRNRKGEEWLDGDMWERKV
jgi:hypothetical protein